MPSWSLHRVFLSLVCAISVLIASFATPVTAQEEGETDPTTAPAPTEAPTTPVPTEAPTTPVPTEAPTTTVPQESDTSEAPPVTDGDTSTSNPVDTTVVEGETTTTIEGETTTPEEDTTPETTAPVACGSLNGADQSISTTTPAVVAVDEEGNPIEVICGTEEDPAAGEGGVDDTVPDVVVTIPLPQSIPGEDFDFSPWAPTEVLVGSVEEAREKLETAEGSHLAAVSQVKSLRLRKKELELRVESLDDESRETLEQLLVAEKRLRQRATAAFVRGDSFGPSLDHDDVLDREAQQTLVDTVFELDRAAVAEYSELRDELDVEALSTFDRLILIDELAEEAEADVEFYLGAVDQAARELIVFEAGSSVYIENVLFPIAGDYSKPLINSWHFPRSGGRVHKGIDIFAPHGTPLIAAERGVITDIGVGKLGGLKVWLRGESGTDWYYAHLSAFAPDLVEGQVVEAGDLLGYVGTTGNAVGTPPHLHLQIHPNGGDAVNPYPLLNVIAERDALLIAEGLFESVEYEGAPAPEPDDSAASSLAENGDDASSTTSSPEAVPGSTTTVAQSTTVAPDSTAETNTTATTTDEPTTAEPDNTTESDGS